MQRWRKIICIIVVIIALCITGYNIFFYYSDDEIAVEDFVLQIDNKLLSKGSLNKEFVTSHSIDYLYEIVKNEYIEASIVLEDDTIKVVKDNEAYFIKYKESKNYLWIKRYVYDMEMQAFGLEHSGSEILLPFPKEYLDVRGAYSEEMSVDCEIEQLADFYKDFTNVTIDDNVILLDMEQDVKIEYFDGKIKVEFVD